MRSSCSIGIDLARLLRPVLCQSLISECPSFSPSILKELDVIKSILYLLLLLLLLPPPPLQLQMFVFLNLLRLRLRLQLQLLPLSLLHLRLNLLLLHLLHRHLHRHLHVLLHLLDSYTSVPCYPSLETQWVVYAPRKERRQQLWASLCSACSTVLEHELMFSR